MLPAFLGLLPFFIFISIGTIGGYFKLFDQKNARALNLFVFYVAIPALIIEIVSGHKSDYLNLELLGIYVLMQLIVGITSFYVTKVYFLKSLPESIIWALTVSLSNHVLLVYPISKAMFDQSVSMQVSSIIVMDILLLISIITFCLEYVTKKKITRVKKLFYDLFLLIPPILLQMKVLNHDLTVALKLLLVDLKTINSQ